MKICKTQERNPRRYYHVLLADIGKLSVRHCLECEVHTGNYHVNINFPQMS